MGACELTKYTAFGFFNAYGNPVRKDSVDYVLHLGYVTLLIFTWEPRLIVYSDYIYEYKNGE